MRSELNDPGYESFVIIVSQKMRLSHYTLGAWGNDSSSRCWKFQDRRHHMTWNGSNTLSIIGKEYLQIQTTFKRFDENSYKNLTSIRLFNKLWNSSVENIPRKWKGARMLQWQQKRRTSKMDSTNEADSSWFMAKTFFKIFIIELNSKRHSNQIWSKTYCC